jgi:hypothetical protein
VFEERSEINQAERRIGIDEIAKGKVVAEVDDELVCGHLRGSAYGECSVAEHSKATVEAIKKLILGSNAQ